MRSLFLVGALIASLSTGVAPCAAADVIRRQQSIRSLPGQLDAVLMVNDNNPELLSIKIENVSKWQPDINPVNTTARSAIAKTVNCFNSIKTCQTQQSCLVDVYRSGLQI